ncbi:MAG TPA: DUF2169 domain-containing protein, partial [Minicystis sp.]|nr:DUF2169 domain-containing protein [Minicystis sp.]
EVAVRVGAWRKRLVAFGDRRWRRGLAGWTLTSPEPFTSLPLVYERAFGGAVESGGRRDACEANPIGVGFGRTDRDADGAPAPNLEDPDHPMQSPADRPRPMAFGPVPRAWPERLRRAGTFDERWRRTRRPLVPDDFDDLFHQSAPADQWARLEGGEPVELAGVSARGVLSFELPRVDVSMRSRVAGREVEHAPSLHVVRFEPDAHRVTLLYQSALPCHRDVHALERTTVEAAARAA